MPILSALVSSKIPRSHMICWIDVMHDNYMDLSLEGSNNTELSLWRHVTSLKVRFYWYLTLKGGLQPVTLTKFSIRGWKSTRETTNTSFTTKNRPKACSFFCMSASRTRYPCQLALFRRARLLIYTIFHFSNTDYGVSGYFTVR